MTEQSIAAAGQNIPTSVTDPAFQGADPADKESASTDQVRQLFDTKAATWAAKYAPGGRLVGRVRLFKAALVTNVPPGGQVLDLGCGTGELARVLASDGWLVTACDISEHMLRRAIARDEVGTVDWVLLNPSWRVLPFEPASFDAIIASSLLEYVEDPNAVLHECARVLGPGGIVLCTVPNLTHPIRWLEWLVDGATYLLRLRKAARHWPLLGGYMVYLQISSHRHLSRWWHATAYRANLRPIACAVNRRGHTSLRLLAFGRPKNTGEMPQ